MDQAARQELEQQLLLDRGDEATWAVYGDLLQQAGFPPGEVIALEREAAAATKGNTAQRFSDLTKNAIFRGRDWYWGDTWEVARLLELEWRHGFVDTMTLTAGHSADQVRELLLANASSFLRVLSLPDLPPDVLAVLKEKQRPVLELRVRHDGLGLGADRFNARPRVGASDLNAAFPLLSALDVDGVVLELDAPLPALERLEVREEWRALHPTLERALVEGWLPALTELAVPRLDAACVEALVGSSVAPQLVRLECPELGDELAWRVLDERARFTSLQAVRPGRSVSADVRTALDEAFKKRRGRRSAG